MDTDQINDLYWWAQERVQGFMSGLHRSPDFGYSVEFAQHRQYVSGDSPKHIDWSVYAKTDRFLTKLYEAESNMRTFFVLDSSSSMYYPNEDAGKWERTVQVITLIASLLQKQRDAMGMLEISETRSKFFEAKATNDWVKLLLNHLYAIEGEVNKNAAIAIEIETLLTKVPRRSQIILFIDLFQDKLEEIIDAAALLVHEGHSVRFAFISHSELEEDAEQFSGKQVFDSETGAKTFLDQNDAMNYVSFVKAQKQRATTLCRNVNLNCKVLDASREPMYLLRELLA